MQPVATPEQMKKLDLAAMRQCGIPGILLMENAGRAFCDLLEGKTGGWTGKEVLVFCGRGNNGGDGFVIARHLANRGATVRVLLTDKRTRVRGDALTNLKIALQMSRLKGAKLRFAELTSLRALGKLGPADVIVDALVGTGFSGALEGLLAQVATWINRSGSEVFAVDIASGVNGANGAVDSVAVKADTTVTMGLPKVGHFVGAGQVHTGNLMVADIGIPPGLLAPVAIRLNRPDVSDVGLILPSRPVTAHKHSVGKILIVAGSRGYTGAPYLASLSALRTGAGAVVLGVPESVHPILAKKATEVMVTPLPETGVGSISLQSRAAIQEKVDWADVVAIGPGLSRNEETMKLVQDLVLSITKPLIIDADGLTALSKSPGLLKKRKGPTILTPHVGEMSRISGEPAAAIEIERVRNAERISRKLQSIIVLKGAPTVTAFPDGRLFLNSTGNPGMATAGSGDVLTGVIAGLAGQGLGAGEAAMCGVFLHGLAGDLAEKRYGQRGLLALDIAEKIPDALKQADSAVPFHPN